MPNEQRAFTLEELSEQTGISSQMVRFYVQSQLLDPPVTGADGSRYTSRHSQRLADIRAWQAEGLTLEDIRRRFKGFRNPWYCQSAD